MEFLVDMVTTVPEGTPDVEVGAMRIREAARSRELAAQGHLVRLWRPPLDVGEWRGWGLFQAADATEMENVLSSMPLRVWRHDTATPLTAHPSDPQSSDVQRHQTSTDEADLLDAVLTRWKAAVDAHQPEQVAALFTTEAIFQGLHPYSVGQAGVAEYYAAQPTGMTAAYTVRETRALSDGVVLGYLTVDFGFSDRASLTVYLSVIIRQDVGHQVSRLDSQAWSWEVLPTSRENAGRGVCAGGGRTMELRQLPGKPPAVGGRSGGGPVGPAVRDLDRAAAPRG